MSISSIFICSCQLRSSCVVLQLSEFAMYLLHLCVFIHHCTWLKRYDWYIVEQEMYASQNTLIYINYQTVKNYIYSNGDLDLWHNDPKIYMVLPLPQGNHVVKFGKDPIYRTSYHVETILLSKILFTVTVTLTFDLMTPK